jgi:hypothetical protein
MDSPSNNAFSSVSGFTFRYLIHFFKNSNPARL